MTDKVLLSKANFTSNLKDSKQGYKIEHLTKVVEEGKVIYPDKVRLMITAPGRKGEDSFLSLYFLDPSQLKLFILDLLRAYKHFKIVNGYFDYHYEHYQMSDSILKIFKEQL